MDILEHTSTCLICENPDDSKCQIPSKHLPGIFLLEGPTIMFILSRDSHWLGFAITINVVILMMILIPMITIRPETYIFDKITGKLTQKQHIYSTKKVITVKEYPLDEILRLSLVKQTDGDDKFIGYGVILHLKENKQLEIKEIEGFLFEPKDKQKAQQFANKIAGFLNLPKVRCPD